MDPRHPLLRSHVKKTVKKIIQHCICQLKLNTLRVVKTKSQGAVSSGSSHSKRGQLAILRIKLALRATPKGPGSDQLGSDLSVGHESLPLAENHEAW